MSTSTPNAPVRFKAHCNRLHTLSRALERYGVALDHDGLREIERRIDAGGPDVYMLRPDHRGKERALFAVRLGDRWLPVVYDAATSSAITVLPPHALLAYRHVFDPTVPPPAVPAPPPATQRSQSVAFVGEIVGHVELDADTVARIRARYEGPDGSTRTWPKKLGKHALAGRDPLAGLPHVPDLSDTPTEEEAAAVIEFIRIRREAVGARLMSRHWKGLKPPLISEVSRLSKLLRECRKAGHEAYIRRYRAALAEAANVDGNDPTSLLLRLSVAFRSVGKRLGWDVFTQEEHDARKFAVFYLEAQGLLPPEP